MKKAVKLATFSLFVASLSLLSTSCKKNADRPAVTNTAVIKLNGAQPPVDSVTTMVGVSNSTIKELNITVWLNHSKYTVCEIQFYFSPSDPLYATGAIIDFASFRYAEVIYKNGSTYYDDYMHPYHSGTITITKNDVTARRIEGILNNCVATENGSNAVTIDGSFAVTY